MIWQKLQPISQELCNPRAAAELVSKITEKIRELSRHPGIGAPLSSVVDIQGVQETGS